MSSIGLNPQCGPETGAPRSPGPSVRSKDGTCARTIASAAVGLILVGVLCSRGRLFWKPPLLLLAILLIPWLGGWILRRARPPRIPFGNLRFWIPAITICAFLLLHFFSSAVIHRWYYFPDWFPADGNLIRWGAARMALLTAILAPMFVIWKRHRALLLGALLLSAQIAAAVFFLQETRGIPLYRIDHPSFMFRLHEFARTFPQLLNYMPHWNGGTLHFAGTVSGAAGPGLLLWPALRAWPAHVIYPWALVLLFVGLAPLLGAAAVRAAGGDRMSSFAGGLLALGVSQHYFLWTLHFGTIGSGFSVAWAAPVCALAFRILWMRRAGWKSVLAFAVCAFFLAQWLPHAVALALGMTLAFPFVVRRCTRRAFLLIALGVGGALLLYSHWGWTLWSAGGSLVDHVVQSPRETVAAGWTWSLIGSKSIAGLSHLRAHLKEGHPLLLFLGIGGLAVVRSRGLRRWFGPILLVLALVTGWSAQIMPNSQLSRMSIALFHVALVPAAIFIGRILRARDERLAPVQALVAAVLILGAWNVARIYRNQSRAPYTVMEAPIAELASWIREQVPEDGRVLFAGRCVHGYGKGKVAYLPVLTGREMMATDYYGFPPGRAEYEYPPAPYRNSDAGLLKFFEVYNVTHVISYHEQPWIEYFRGNPDAFEEVHSVKSTGRLTWVVFRVRRDSSRLSGARGRVEADFNRLTVTFEDTPPDSVLLRYNWNPGLRASPPAVIMPREVSPGITLMELQPRGLREVTIRYRPPNGRTPP
ncbi:MAG: hypothetical protein KBA51_07525 [Kiritimatiellae bacterium]|nr:hypothetical protein [Kiritimatiellia bacterium]